MNGTARGGWVLPVLLAVAASAALGLGFLYAVRPNAGDLGAVRVVVTDDDGKGGALRVLVTTAPLAQKETVSPRAAFTGVVYYPAPYLTRPNLKLACPTRGYAVTAETELGFTWLAEPRPEDFRDDVKGNAASIERFLGLSLAFASAQGKLRPGLVFEDFTWEAKGLPAPAGAVPRTIEQKGTFTSIQGQEGPVFFPVPYASAPNVELGGSYRGTVVVTECTAKSFRWKNTAGDRFGDGEVPWTARGVAAPAEGK